MVKNDSKNPFDDCIACEHILIYELIRLVLHSENVLTTKFHQVTEFCEDTHCHSNPPSDTRKNDCEYTDVITSTTLQLG